MNPHVPHDPQAHKCISDNTNVQPHTVRLCKALHVIKLSLRVFIAIPIFAFDGPVFNVPMSVEDVDGNHQPNVVQQPDVQKSGTAHTPSRAVQAAIELVYLSG